MQQSFQLPSGSKYQLNFISMEWLFDGLITCPVCEIILETIDAQEAHEPEVFHEVSNRICAYLAEQTAIVFIYCNHQAIPKSSRRKELSNALYKSQLFDTLYEKKKLEVTNSGQLFSIEKHDVEMDIEGEDNHHVRVFTNPGNEANLNEFICRFLKRETPVY